MLRVPAELQRVRPRLLGHRRRSPIHTARMLRGHCVGIADRSEPADRLGHPVDHRAGGDADDGQARSLRFDDRHAESLVGHARNVDIGASQPARELGPVLEIAGHDDPLVAKRRDLGFERPFADQGELGPQRLREHAERFGDDIGLLLAVEPAGIDRAVAGRRRGQACARSVGSRRCGPNSPSSTPSGTTSTWSMPSGATSPRRHFR